MALQCSSLIRNVFSLVFIARSMISNDSRKRSERVLVVDLERGALPSPSPFAVCHSQKTVGFVVHHLAHPSRSPPFAKNNWVRGASALSQSAIRKKQLGSWCIIFAISPPPSPFAVRHSQKHLGSWCSIFAISYPQSPIRSSSHTSCDLQ